MATIGTLIRDARRRRGWTQNTLAARVGCSDTFLSMMESGRRGVTEPWARRLEAALGAETGFLVRAVRWQRLDPAHRDEVQTARAVTDRVRKALRPGSDLDALYATGELRALVEQMSENVSEPLPVRQIPVINSVSAGYPAEFTDLDHPASIADDYIACPDITDPNAFAARVVGDSMEPDYREGDIVVFAPNQPTPTASDCFVRLERDNETTFKRIFHEDDGATIRLQPLNATYPPRLVPREDISGMYVAVYVMRPITP